MGGLAQGLNACSQDTDAIHALANAQQATPTGMYDG
jgi:hypothetical protein